MKKTKVINHELLEITETIDHEFRSVESFCGAKQIEQLKSKLFGKTKDEMRDWMNEILEEEEWETMRIKDIVSYMEQQLLVSIITHLTATAIDIEKSYASEFHWVIGKNEHGQLENGMSVKWLWSL